ncbi:hypothetical protein [Lentilitoribacter sp. EG35]
MAHVEESEAFIVANGFLTHSTVLK